MRFQFNEESMAMLSQSSIVSLSKSQDIFSSGSFQFIFMIQKQWCDWRSGKRYRQDRESWNFFFFVFCLRELSIHILSVMGFCIFWFMQQGMVRRIIIMAFNLSSRSSHGPLIKSSVHFSVMIGGIKQKRSAWHDWGNGHLPHQVQLKSSTAILGHLVSNPRAKLHRAVIWLVFHIVTVKFHFVVWQN